MICCKDDHMWNSSWCDCECNKICKFDKYLDIRNFSCKFRLTGKLVEGPENEYNTIKTWLDEKKAKNNCLIHKISSVIICMLLLAVISIGCHYYYTRDWTKKNT